MGFLNKKQIVFATNAGMIPNFCAFVFFYQV